MGQPPPEGGVRFLNNLSREKVPKSIKSLKPLFPTPVWNKYHSPLWISPNIYISDILRIIIIIIIIIIKIIKMCIIYFTIKCQLVLKSLHTLHTIHIIPPPDIVTGWHILCLIYFVCTIQALIKQEQRSPHSWCHYTNFQKGAAPLSSPPQRDHQALSLARGPGTLPPNPLQAPDTSVLKVLSTPDTHSIDHIAPLLSVPTQSIDKWNIIIFYILNRPPTQLILNTNCPMCIPLTHYIVSSQMYD